MIGTKIYKPVKDWNEYTNCALWCNENNATIEDKGDFYEVVNIPKPSEKELLLNEKSTLEEWLKTHYYISVMITAGKATAEEYNDEINLMAEKVNRINEIDSLLATM